MNKPRSYSRFYALLKRMPGDREELKQTLVGRFTAGRTTSLREMRLEEYDAMCRALEAEIAHPGITTDEAQAEVKRHRSSVLRRMQKLGIDTTDWNAVDAFCLSPRIAEKRFCQLSIEELRALIPKLEAILRKPKKAPRRVVHTIIIKENQLPS
ncbi:hypothetical protein [uncultured Alistipes sp.]|uniref:hypothetical protein n=1 Tax=uncultured Alistipes sp. TaxID=538949 RepID=UPI0025FAEE05|nr:hypothetical protein [uncultured Alistipes sp.]